MAVHETPASVWAGLHPRRAAAVNAARLAGWSSRLLGRGGGTALPGLVATRIYPAIVAELASQLPVGSWVVSGTNGKTTTARLLGGILADAGFHPIRNAAGSNLERGLATTLVSCAGLLGNLRTSPDQVGLFEVDEAALPSVLHQVRPRGLLLLNLFRDQLDRYGEVATVAALWRNGMARLPAATLLVANGDDPLVTEAALSAGRLPRFFGIESDNGRTARPEHAGDAKTCPRCGGAIEYRTLALGHLGSYRCPACGFTRPRPDVWVEGVRLRGMEGSHFTLCRRDMRAEAFIPLPGLYNVYNALAAAAAASAAGIDLPSIVLSLRNATPAFGRMESLDIGGCRVLLALAKNPTGLNQVLHTITSVDEPIHLMMMLNDNTADGHDVSWIWDADLELLDGRLASVVFSGIRAEDMALRFKYAGLLTDTIHWAVEKNTARALDDAVRLTPPNSRLTVIPTYTALLDLRALLTRRGHAHPYWGD